MRKKIALFSMALLLSACSGQPPTQNLAEEGMTLCEDPRPEMCTMDYRPVCAQLDSGEWREYSNGCSACSDPQVVGWRDGNCPEQVPAQP